MTQSASSVRGKLKLRQCCVKLAITGFITTVIGSPHLRLTTYLVDHMSVKLVRLALVKRPHGTKMAACNSDPPTLTQAILHDQAPIASDNRTPYQTTLSDSNSPGSTVCLPCNCISSPSILVRALQRLDQQTTRSISPCSRVFHNS